MDYLFDMPTDFKVYKIKRDKSSGSQPAHTHPYYEIFYLINGDCTFFIDHNIYKLNRGDLIIVPQGELHKSSFPQHGSSELADCGGGNKIPAHGNPRKKSG